jgi:hypothetical protein
MSAKLPGILQKLQDVRFVAACCFLQQLLEILTPLSLTFEKGAVMSHEVMIEVMKTQAKLEQLAEADHPLEDVLAKGGFNLEDSVMQQKVLKLGHHRKPDHQKQYVTLSCDGMKMGSQPENVISTYCKDVLPAIQQSLTGRFESFDDEVFQNMKWIDPSLWHEDPKDDLPQLKFLADYFLKRADSDDSQGSQMYVIKESMLAREWKDFRLLCKKQYPKFTTKQLWKQMFNYRRKNFPNLCKLAECVFSVGPSNSVVEAGFSHLTAMLNDRRRSLSHDTMENLLLLKVNHLVLTDQEREEILQKALDEFLKPGQKRKLTLVEPEEVPRQSEKR